MNDQNKTEEQIESGEIRFRELFNNMRSGVAVYKAVNDGQDFIIIDFNRSAERIENVKKEEIRGRSVLEVFPGVKDFGLFDVFRRVWKTGNPEHHPVSIYRDDRISGWRENYVYRLPTGEIVAIYEDVTGRKQAEEALRESEARYRRITDAITDYIYTVIVKDGDMVETRHGPGCQAVTGYSEEEFAADPYLWIRMVVEEDRPAVQEQARRMSAGEGAPAIEHRIVRKDGVQRWVKNTFVPRHNLQGRLQAYDGLIQDVTERKRAEEALYFAEKRFRNLLENIQLAAVMLDLNGNITFCNEYLLGLAGRSMEEVLNKNWFDLFVPEESRDALMSVFRANISGSAALHNEHHIITREGDLRLIVWDTAVLHGPEGDVTGTASIGIDVSVHRKIEEQLRQAQKMEAIGHLAGGVAHDFNNILNGIIGYQFLIDTKLKADDPLKPYLNEIYELAKKGANLTHSLLAFSRKQVIDPKPVNINDIIMGMEKILNRIIGEDIEFRVNIAAGDLITRVDKGQMEQVLMNLATNARDAMSHGGILTISTEELEIDDRFICANHYGEVGKYAVISVADTGIGMDGKIKENIFEPFFTTKEVGKGTGLGLAMAYGAIKQHNGFIHVYSEPAQGTTFKIFLPQVILKTEKDEKTDPARLSFGNETILLAEDDQGVRKVTRITLEMYGYKVLEAIDGEDALKVFSENSESIKLIITDVIMPKKQGKEVYEEACRIKPGIKCLLMSGYTDEIINKKGILDKGLSFMSKPVIPDNLITKVREVLDS